MGIRLSCFFTLLLITNALFLNLANAAPFNDTGSRLKQTFELEKRWVKFDLQVIELTNQESLHLGFPDLNLDYKGPEYTFNQGNKPHFKTPEEFLKSSAPVSFHVFEQMSGFQNDLNKVLHHRPQAELNRSSVKIKQDEKTQYSVFPFYSPHMIKTSVAGFELAAVFNQESTMLNLKLRLIEAFNLEKQSDTGNPGLLTQIYARPIFNLFHLKEGQTLVVGGLNNVDEHKNPTQLIVLIKPILFESL